MLTPHNFILIKKILLSLAKSSSQEHLNACEESDEHAGLIPMLCCKTPTSHSRASPSPQTHVLPQEHSPAPPWDVSVTVLSNLESLLAHPALSDACLWHLAALLQGLPKGTLCSGYLSRAKQFLAFSLRYSTSCTSTAVCGDAQKTKPVNWSLLKITCWK